MPNNQLLKLRTEARLRTRGVGGRVRSATGRVPATRTFYDINHFPSPPDLVASLRSNIGHACPVSLQAANGAAAGRGEVRPLRWACARAHGHGTRRAELSDVGSRIPFTM